MVFRKRSGCFVFAAVSAICLLSGMEFRVEIWNAGLLVRLVYS